MTAMSRSLVPYGLVDAEVPFLFGRGIFGGRWGPVDWRGERSDVGGTGEDGNFEWREVLRNPLFR